MAKIAFVTCVQLGLSCIEEIYKINGHLDLIITLDDNKSKFKSGRVYLDNISKKHNIPLLKVNNVNDAEVIKSIKDLEIDWLFIIGWSQIAYRELLQTPKNGCIGMHPTLLPEGRGRASVPWAIIKKLKVTGVTMFKLDEGIDTGDIISQEKIELSPDITATELYEKVNNLHSLLIKKMWNNIINNSVTLVKQNNKLATEWPGRLPDDGEIKSHMTMDEAYTLIRATTKPYPGAFVRIDNYKVIIWSAKLSIFSGDYKLSDGYLVFNETEVVFNE